MITRVILVGGLAGSAVASPAVGEAIVGLAALFLLCVVFNLGLGGAVFLERINSGSTIRYRLGFQRRPFRTSGSRRPR